MPRPARRHGPAPAEPLVATLEKRGRFLVAEPLFARGGRRPAIAASDADGARPGDLVLLGGGKRGTRVVRHLGRPDVTRDVLEALMLDRGLRRAFPRAVEDEAAAAAAPSPDAGDARRDLTDLPTFTIDPTDARDFDDAISAVRADGALRLWVHIADVSAYVRPGTQLDREARRRGTSVYVPGAVEPMLPEALSNDACSLRAGIDRMAVSVELELVDEKVRSASFVRSTIRSDARLTYDQVDGIFAGTERAESPWGEALDLARGVAATLSDRRERRGSLAVESSEPVFDFDAAGSVTDIRHEAQTEAHRVIEELMILANEQVAGLLADRRLPVLYRVHEPPDPESIGFLVDQLASLDVATPPLPERMTGRRRRSRSE